MADALDDARYWSWRTWTAIRETVTRGTPTRPPVGRRGPQRRSGPPVGRRGPQRRSGPPAAAQWVGRLVVPVIIALGVVMVGSDLGAGVFRLPDLGNEASADPVEVPIVDPPIRAVSSFTPAESAAEVDLTDTTWVLPLDGLELAALTADHHDYAAWDYSVPTGTDVMAMTVGIVTEAGDDIGSCGGTVRITRAVDSVETTYCHLSDVHVAEGDIVDAGTVIGLSGGIQGAPGAGSSEGEHLHLEVRIGEQLYCPQWLIRSLHTDGTGSNSDLRTSGCVSAPSTSPTAASTGTATASTEAVPTSAPSRSDCTTSQTVSAEQPSSRWQFPSSPCR